MVVHTLQSKGPSYYALPLWGLQDELTFHQWPQIADETAGRTAIEGVQGGV